MIPIRLDRTPITRTQRLAGGIAAAVLALLVGAVVTKDTGLIHGTTTLGAIYCTRLADEFGDTAATPSTGQSCVDMFNSLDPDDQQLLLEDLGR